MMPKIDNCGNNVTLLRASECGTRNKEKWMRFQYETRYLRLRDYQK